MTMVNREGRWRSARVMSVLLRRVERAEGEVPHSSLPPHARSPIHLVFLCTGLYVPCEAQGILVSGENKPPNKHQARPPQDRHCYGRRLRPQAPGPHPLRLRRLNLPPLSLATVLSTHQTKSVWGARSAIQLAVNLRPFMLHSTISLLPSYLSALAFLFIQL